MNLSLVAEFLIAEGPFFISIDVECFLDFLPVIFRKKGLKLLCDNVIMSEKKSRVCLMPVFRNMRSVRDFFDHTPRPLAVKKGYRIL